MTPEQKQALSAPLDRSHVKQREQSGRKLSYIEGWHAIAEANRIFGFDCWTRETLDIRCVSERERKIGPQGRQRDGWGVSYIAKVRVTVDGVVREGIGAGHGIDADLGLAHESAIKEAETDAMKRALMTFGNPFGLALYDKEQAQVCDAPRQSAPAKEPQPLSQTYTDLHGRLLACLSPAQVKVWTTDHQDAFAKLSDDEFEMLKAEKAAHLASFKQEKAA